MKIFEESEASASMTHKLAAALAYAVASTLIMFVNKIVLTGYGFPSFLAVACLQYVTSIIVLLVQRQQGTIPSFPLFSITAIRSVLPVPFIFLLNTVSGLGATKMLNMPLFVLLRRFSIVMTMCLEAYWIGKRFSPKVKSSVALMIAGALIAASSDLTFDLRGVVMILMNNFATAFQGVGLRKKMDQLSHTNVGTSGIMYYNNLVSLPFIILMLVLNPHETALLAQFPHWGRPDFLLALMASGVMGFVLNYCYYWCTKANSPTTTTVIGAFKNILTSYLGMLFADYIYAHVNFLGINVSVAGSLWYNWEELKKMRTLDADRRAREKDVALEQCGACTTARCSEDRGVGCVNNGSNSACGAPLEGGLSTSQLSCQSSAFQTSNKAMRSVRSRSSGLLASPPQPAPRLNEPHFTVVMSGNDVQPITHSYAGKMLDSAHEVGSNRFRGEDNTAKANNNFTSGVSAAVVNPVNASSVASIVPPRPLPYLKVGKAHMQ